MKKTLSLILALVILTGLTHLNIYSAEKTDETECIISPLSHTISPVRGEFNDETAEEDMIVAVRVRKPDSSALTEAELSSVRIYDTGYVLVSQDFFAGKSGSKTGSATTAIWFGCTSTA